MKPLGNNYSLPYKRDSFVYLMENIWQCTLCLPNFHFFFFFMHSQSVQLFMTLRTSACQAPLSMRFCWQEYWSGLRFPPPASVPNPGIEPTSPALQEDSLPLGHTQEAPKRVIYSNWSQSAPSKRL